ncbi:MAG: VOC family protein [Microbacterium sp.]
MTATPAAHHRRGAGLVGVHPYQLGYVTTDLDEAIDGYARTLGGVDFSISDRTLRPRLRHVDSSLRVRFGLGFVGDVMVELIEPVSGETGFYADLLPPSGFGIALHHFGYLLDPRADWGAFRAAVDEERVAFELSGDPNVVYLDTRAELGHYVEYLHFTPDVRDAWLARIPRNG